MDSAYLAALKDAPVATPAHTEGSEMSGWPLVIFNHGYGGSLEIYSSIVQEIASHGHVVVVVHHGDGSASTTLSVLARNGDRPKVHGTQLNQRVTDVRRVLQQLTTLKSDLQANKSQLSEIIRTADLANTHIVGHSFGAATAIATAYVDDRFRSVVLHDGVMYPVSKDVQAGIGSRIPVFRLISEQYLEHCRENAEMVKAHMRRCTHEKSELQVPPQQLHGSSAIFATCNASSPRRWNHRPSVLYANKVSAQLSVAFLHGQLHAKAPEFPEAVPVKEVVEGNY